MKGNIMRLFIVTNLLAVLAVLAMIYGPLALFATYVSPVGVL